MASTKRSISASTEASARTKSGQDPSLQIGSLDHAGCDRIFEEKAAGARRNLPRLREAVRYIREEDVLAAGRLDRLARSLRRLIETVEY